MGKDKIERLLGRRERKKQQTREALESTAWRLFQRKGYDATTIEDITDAVDVSTRTFFRYFDSKEAVLFGDWRSNLERITDLIAGRPSDEPPLQALYEAARQFVEIVKPNEPRLLMRNQLAKSSRKIGDYERNVINPEFERVVCEALARRLGVDPGSDPRPYMAAAVAVAAYNAARKKWMASGGELSMSELLSQAFEFIDYKSDVITA
ncbi:MAG: TetR family transcriptional regulator [Actinobacteria bacterium]|nr:TetR family transcriptional regulator [Actinomycetota bacterium]